MDNHVKITVRHVTIRFKTVRFFLDYQLLYYFHIDNIDMYDSWLYARFEWNAAVLWESDT